MKIPLQYRCIILDFPTAPFPTITTYEKEKWKDIESCSKYFSIRINSWFDLKVYRNFLIYLDGYFQVIFIQVGNIHVAGINSLFKRFNDYYSSPLWFIILASARDFYFRENFLDTLIIHFRTHLFTTIFYITISKIILWFTWK